MLIAILQQRNELPGSEYEKYALDHGKRLEVAGPVRENIPGRATLRKTVDGRGPANDVGRSGEPNKCTHLIMHLMHCT